MCVLVCILACADRHARDYVARGLAGGGDVKGIAGVTEAGGTGGGGRVCATLIINGSVCELVTGDMGFVRENVCHC